MESVHSIQKTNRTSIAIVGMACVYPGAHSPEELWHNVLAGRRFCRKLPPERLPGDYLDPDPKAPGKSYCDQAALITDWAFDPVEFRIPPKSVDASDIAHWLALATAKGAIEDAGFELDSLDRTRVSVVLGNTLTGEFSRSHSLRHRWPYVERAIRRALGSEAGDAERVDALVSAIQRVYEAPLPEINEDTLAGSMSNTIAGRVCNHFDLGGGGHTVDGACASSLLAVASGCRSLLDKEVDIVLAGGIDVSLDAFELIGFAKTGALAKDDIRPYDQRAEGMLPGEGCGIVALMRAEEARAAGHTIHALIRGWGHSSDGSGGITAPKVEGQMRALERAYTRAGYGLFTVGLIEGHGTGTRLGDEVEITALRRLLESEAAGGSCRIGSIKGNIGHCKAAAGAAGLIKAVMALRQKILPPTGNCARPSLAFGRPIAALEPNLEGSAWLPANTPRRASVSAMGFGGVNAHLTLEESNPGDHALEEELALLGSEQTSELIPLSASSAHELKERVDSLIATADRICRAELTDLAAALSALPTHGDQRLAFVAESPWQLSEALRRASKLLEGGANMADMDDPGHGTFAGHAGDAPCVVGLFPGQGSQHLGMGSHLVRRYPFVRELIERAEGAVEDVVSGGLGERIFRRPELADESELMRWRSELRDTKIAQPAIALASIATTEVLRSVGLVPDLLIGHSLGEIVALQAAGICAPETAVRLAALRGRAMSALDLRDPGGMAAVATGPDVVEKLLDELDSPLVISNYNSNRQTVVSGPHNALRSFQQLCDTRDVRCQPLDVSHAFHSPIVAPAARAFVEALAGVPLHPLSASVISTSTGHAIEADADLRVLLGEHIARPVRFLGAVLEAAERKPALWIELGPGGALTGLVRDILGENSACLPTELPDQDGFHTLNRVLARAFVLGVPLKLDRLFDHRYHQAFPIDDYDPAFIVNPCERPVEVTGLAEGWLNGFANALPNSLVPDGAERTDLSSYLESRGAFLKDLIALDYRHHGKHATRKDSSAATNAKGSEAETSTTTGMELEISEAAAGTGESILDDAIDWIVQRTGFPRDFVTADKLLVQDLNLDSIKIGELIVTLARKLGVAGSYDPADLIQTSLVELTQHLEGQLHGDAGERSHAREIQPGALAAGAGNWARAFQMQAVEAPLHREHPLPPLDPGSALIIAKGPCPRARAIAAHFEEQGLTPITTEWESLLAAGGPPSDLRALVVVLSETQDHFLAGSETDLDTRVGSLVEELFGLLQWLELGRSERGSSLRTLVLRPYAAGDPGVDLDAGASFLRSVGFEHASLQGKWIALPARWNPDRWVVAVDRELASHTDCRAFRYDEGGRRWTDLAQPLAEPQPGNHRLGSADVALVSGGGKGITAELALALAEHTGVRLALLGSSPAPETPDDDSELAENLRRFSQRGIEHVYVQCDVTDRDAVAAAVARVEDELGPVTAILHGAGFTQPVAFRDARLDDYRRCIEVKVRGLHNLLSAIPPERLSSLQVVSSVLAKTGMRGQADYAFANAWLDAALASLRSRHPSLHLLSLGYSVWEGTGLGVKLGTLESLRSIGVNPLSIEEGVALYRQLLDQPDGNSTFVATSSLTSDLESILYGEAPALRPRFLERVLRWVPGAEVVADATLSHSTDLHLSEHVFDGTPLLAGVMAMEAMVEAAGAAAGRSDLPVLRHLRFHKPLIVPVESSVTMRTFAAAELADDGIVRVRTVIRSDADDFERPHYEAMCVFGEPPLLQAQRPSQPPAAAILDRDPEEFSPTPLFQGKLFRRIQALRRLDPELKVGATVISDVLVPEDERYYDRSFFRDTTTPSPAARDSFFQTGAIILPPGCLPSSLGELRIHRSAIPGERLVCRAGVRDEVDGKFFVDIDVFTNDGELVETMTDLVLELPQRSLPKADGAGPESIPLCRIAEDLAALLPDVPHALAWVRHGDLQQEREACAELSETDRKRAARDPAAGRIESRLANLVAARRAVREFARLHREDLDIELSDVSIVRLKDGKPELRFADPVVAKTFEGVGVSLSDRDGISVALVGPAPLGIDLEIVESRDAETWRGLLGDEAYALVHRLSAVSGERFDAAATRVWTLLEATKKANGLRARAPRYESSLGGPWHSLSGLIDYRPQDLLSVAVTSLPESGQPAAIAVTLQQPKTPGHAPVKITGPAVKAAGDEFFRLLDGFSTELQSLAKECNADPDDLGCETRYSSFELSMRRVLSELQKVEERVDRDGLPGLRQAFQRVIRPFLEGSDVFRHSLAKPLGYPGDFLLLDKLVQENCTSRGLARCFDRFQLEHPASRGCRVRVDWVHRALVKRLARSGGDPLAILDLGVGAAPVERRLLSTHPHAEIDLAAVDLELAALEFVERTVAGPKRRVHPYRLDLTNGSSLAAVAELASTSDVCIAIGILEALPETAAQRVLDAVLRRLPAGGAIYTECFIPTNDSRRAMEWMMDFSLAYRSAEDLTELALRAGARSDQINLHVDAVGVALLEIKT